jgi:hypothetical protein
MDGGTTLGSANLVSGKASFAYSGLALGSHSITATYNGDTNFTGSVSAALSEVVNQDGTTAKITSSANPAVWGQVVVFTATVTPKSPGSGVPTGTATFYDGNTLLATVTMSNGKAAYATNSLSIGTHSIKVVYSGDANFTGCTSSAFSQTVNKARSTVSLSSSANPSPFGQPLTLTAAVSPVYPGAGVPTGTVIFMDGSKVIGSATLSGGSASITISSLARGTHHLTAKYGGDADFNSSTSGVLNESIV